MIVPWTVARRLSRVPPASKDLSGEESLPERLSAPSTAGLDLGQVPQPPALHLQLGSRLVPGPCQQNSMECHFPMFCLLTVAHKDLKVSDVCPICWLW